LITAFIKKDKKDFFLQKLTIKNTEILNLNKKYILFIRIIIYNKV